MDRVRSAARRKLVAPSSATWLLAVVLVAPALAEHRDAAASNSPGWWSGSGATAPESGLNRFLRERGVRFGGHYYGALFGIQRSASGSARPWDDGAQLNLDVSPDQLLAAPTLAGLVLTAQGRWRAESASADPNSFVHGNAMFDPSNWASGTGWRLLQISASYTASLGGPVADRLWLKAGWVQPRYEFALQPMTERILNNAVNSAKGIGGNIPFSSSFSTWGAMARLRGSDAYAKAGVFMSYPDATASANHGVRFAGGSTHNGVMSMAEIAATPTSLFGSSLSGKYALGGYAYDNVDDVSTMDGSANFGFQTGAYLQADQRLYREGGAGDAQQAVEPQGVTCFGLLMLAPARNNQFQLYAHAGLNYTGVLPRRERDALIFAVAYGNYARATHEDTTFVETGYHVGLNRWLDLYPFVQYAVRPAGTPDVADAVILGFAANVAF